jgi:hypothetical protein
MEGRRRKMSFPFDSGCTLKNAMYAIFIPGGVLFYDLESTDM